MLSKRARRIQTPNPTQKIGKGDNKETQTNTKAEKKHQKTQQRTEKEGTATTAWSKNNPNAQFNMSFEFPHHASKADYRHRVSLGFET